MSCLGNSLIGSLEKSLVDTVLDRKSLFRFEHKSVDSFCHSLEEQIAISHNASGSILLPSASVAWSLILEVLNISKNTVALTCPFGWAAIYSGAIRKELQLDFVRYEKLFSIDLAHLESKLSENVVGVIVIPHLMGRGVENIGKVKKLADRYDVPLVEDIAQAFGVKVGEDYAGAFGVAAYSSFNRHKVISAGDGGVAIFKREEDYLHAWRIHDQGCLPNGNTRKVSPQHFIPGSSLRVNELTGAVLKAQYAKMFWIRSKVWEIYSALSNALGSQGFKVIAAQAGDIPSTVLFDHKGQLADYPSLLDSGWHVFTQIPYAEDLKGKISTEDQSLLEGILSKTSAVGCGFIDKYFSTPVGIELEIDAEELEERTEALIRILLS
ncbi:MAG: hypothetical protein GKR95_00740 [Gammaproteobacteria bacterium]|nr:hypothetical protein [Gammaproteobacteria bacterium]